MIRVAGRVTERRTSRAGVQRLALGLALLAGCASPGMPPGGPPDRDPPALLGTDPETLAVNVRAPRIVFRFDEVVNERSSPGMASTTSSGSSSSGGASGGFGGGNLGGGFSGGFGGSAMGGEASLAAMFAISPSDGRERVRWRREAIEIEPRGGFRPNTTYQVVLLPGLSDLRGNARKEATSLLFSTGPTLASGTIDGVVFDWVGGKPAAGARLEAFAPGDTSFRWRTRADSSGRFVLPSLASGRYHVRGWLDQNQNGQVDGREAFDTVTVALVSTAKSTLYAFEHDTIGPRIESVELVDSTALRLKFDRAPATDWSPLATTVTLQRADSSLVTLDPVLPTTVFDSVRAARTAKADSTATDTVAVAPEPSPRAAPVPTRVGPPVGRAGGVRDAAPQDTTPRIPPPVLDRPVPILSWVVPLQSPLAPGLYRLKVRGVRGLTGRVRDSEREIRVRPPAPPKDSTAAGRAPTAARRDSTSAPRDTTAARPRRP